MSSVCLIVNGDAEIEAASTAGDCMVVVLLFTAALVIVTLLYASYPTAALENATFPAAAAEYVHTKVLFEPAAMFAGVAAVIIVAFPVPAAVGVIGTTEFAKAPPLFVTLIVTVINWPTDTCAGDDTSELINDAEFTMLTIFEAVAPAVNVVPLAWSNPFASALNVIAPAEAA
jgi:hypothetical protein